MKKVTKATLKSLAKKGKLSHTVNGEFDGMLEGMKANEKNTQITTLKDVERFTFCDKNYITASDNEITLSNCCFHITFQINN